MRLLSSTAIATILLAASVQAGGPTVLTRSNTDGYLVDQAQALTPADRAAINAKLLAYKARTTNEFAVVIVPDLGGEDLQAYANTLFHAWGIGLKGKDNGVLFLWTLKEKKVRLEVGRGLEESLPDGRAGIIIRDAIIPHFKAQRWRAGVEGGVDAVIAQLDYKPVVPVKAGAPSTPASLDLYFIIPFILVGAGLVAFFVWYMKENEPPPHLTPDTSPTRSPYTDFSALPRRSAEPFRPASRVTPAATRAAGVIPTKRKEPERRREESHSTYIPIPIPYDSGSNSSSSSDSSSWGGSSDSGSSFGGGDSGGGGADGGY